MQRTAEALQQSKKPLETALDRLDVVSARIARAHPTAADNRDCQFLSNAITLPLTGV
jgi:hypothetical protein